MLHHFEVTSHHKNVSFMITTQNLLRKETKMFARNASDKVYFFDKVFYMLSSVYTYFYYIQFYFQSDNNYVSILSQQMGLGPSFLPDCFSALFIITEEEQNPEGKNSDINLFCQLITLLIFPDPEIFYVIADSSSASQVPKNLILRSRIFPNKEGKTNMVFFAVIDKIII